MMGQRRLRYVEPFKQHACAFFSTSEHFEYHQPVFITEGLEYNRLFLVLTVHSVPLFISIFVYLRTLYLSYRFLSICFQIFSLNKEIRKSVEGKSNYEYPHCDYTEKHSQQLWLYYFFEHYERRQRERSHSHHE